MISVKGICSECGGELEITEIRNGIRGFAEIELTVDPCQSCVENIVEEEVEKDENFVNSLREIIRKYEFSGEK